MYKIGDQYISLRDIFSISDLSFYSGSVIYVQICSKQGAKTRVEFRARNEDEARMDGPVPDSFKRWVNSEIQLLLTELTKQQK